MRLLTLTHLQIFQRWALSDPFCIHARIRMWKKKKEKEEESEKRKKNKSYVRICLHLQTDSNPLICIHAMFIISLYLGWRVPALQSADACDSGDAFAVAKWSQGRSRFAFPCKLVPVVLFRLASWVTIFCSVHPRMEARSPERVRTHCVFRHVPRVVSFRPENMLHRFCFVGSLTLVTSWNQLNC